MKIAYKTKALERKCSSLTEAKKQYGDKVSEALLAAVNFIQNAGSLVDVINFSPFHFHHMKGKKRKGQYAIDLAGRKSGFRLILVPLNNNGDKCTNEEVFGKGAIDIVLVHLEEVTNHYE